VSTLSQSLEGGDHLSVAEWRKSSRSNATQECVEAAFLPGVTAVRDSKNPAGPVLTFAPTGWTNFLSAIKSGDFDAR
jgi:hypothetical protein